ncbi:MAG: septation protein SepH, partial [Actinomycetota bacterium]|nr:septation protein SepH [Actinomycetota bacterium]
MIDVHLIGYTADLRHIVLDLEPGQRGGRYRLEIDLDLFLTLDEVRERRRAAGLEAGPPIGAAGEVDEAGAAALVVLDTDERDFIVDDEIKGPAPDASAPHPEVGRGDPPDGREGYWRDRGAPQTNADTATASDASSLSTEELGATSGPDPADSPSAQADLELNGESGPVAPPPTPQPESRLTPAEIQALLRAGRSLRTVAKLAGIDVQRVERWLTPILAERTQVIQEALATPLGSATGNSRQPLVAAVTRNLSLRGIEIGHLSWTANRRSDGRWTVQLRYRDEDRVRCASWSFDRRDRTLTAGSALALELGWNEDPGDREEDEPARSRRTAADALVEARLAQGMAPT